MIGESGKSFTIIWVSAHTGIRGNEEADELAKSSANLIDIKEQYMTFEDCKSKGRKLIWEVRENDWREFDPENKLRKIVNSVTVKQDLTGLTRKEATVISRLRIGHTNRTHAYLFEEYQIPELCECDEFFDYEHFFECEMGQRARRGFGITGREMLSSNDLSTLKRVIGYLKFMDWYWKI